MNNTYNNCRKIIKTFWKFVNGLIKSNTKNRLETLADDSGSIFSSHASKTN